jgi:hypothetical protein
MALSADFTVRLQPGFAKPCQAASRFGDMAIAFEGLDQLGF